MINVRRQYFCMWEWLINGCTKFSAEHKIRNCLVKKIGACLWDKDETEYYYVKQILSDTFQKGILFYTICFRPDAYNDNDISGWRRKWVGVFIRFLESGKYQVQFGYRENGNGAIIEVSKVIFNSHQMEDKTHAFKYIWTYSLN